MSPVFFPRTSTGTPPWTFYGTLSRTISGIASRTPRGVLLRIPRGIFLGAPPKTSSGFPPETSFAIRPGSLSAIPPRSSSAIPPGTPSGIILGSSFEIPLATPTQNFFLDIFRSFIPLENLLWVFFKSFFWNICRSFWNYPRCSRDECSSRIILRISRSFSRIFFIVFVKTLAKVSSGLLPILPCGITRKNIWYSKGIPDIPGRGQQIKNPHTLSRTWIPHVEFNQL